MDINKKLAEVVYIRKDQLNKARTSPFLCEVGPNERADKEPIYTADQLRQAQREAIATAVPEWLPIETAPKDVTVLLCGAKRLEMCVGMNHSRDGWVTDTTSGWVSMYPPTHWMPLPPPPEVKP